MGDTGNRGPRALPQHKVDSLGTRAAASASHPAITMEGVRVLSDGGNAVDATLAMAAVGWMVLPGQCGIGGDAFALVREPGGHVWTVCGSGFGPDGGTPDFFRGQGLDALPLSGAQSVTVPGAAAALAILAEHGTRPLGDLWRTGINLAREGVPCTAKMRADLSEHQWSLAADEGAAAAFLPHGRVPEIGEHVVQKDLANFLADLANDPMSFYEGPFASRALDCLTAAGAPFSGEEWSLGKNVEALPAISHPYDAGVLHQTPLPTPGWMMLQQAALCDGLLGEVPLLGAEAIHWLASAARTAFVDRYAECGAESDRWQQLLERERVALARGAIGARVRGRSALAGMRIDGDTTSSVCVDHEGRAVSLIHSLAFTFGARLSVPGTGVLLNNRLGRGAYLVDGHPNEVQPRRKPLHTLNAWAYDSPGAGLVHVGNCPGGDGQVQWNMQVLSHLVDHGLSPQQAVSLPRFTVYPGSDANVVGRPEELLLEPGVDEQTQVTLTRWGHRVVNVPAQVGGPGGSALVIGLDHRHGTLRAGADPRMEGIAIAL